MRLYLYNEPSATMVDIGELARYLRRRLPRAAVMIRDSFVEHVLPTDPSVRDSWLDSFAVAWAQAKVLQPSRPVAPRRPLAGELAYERRRLGAPTVRTMGLVYDGVLVQDACRERLPPTEQSRRQVHLILTRQRVATFCENDLRYHLRVVVAGAPALVSITGLVEAPARPRAYYAAQAAHALLTGPAARELAAETGAKDYLRPDDPRTTEVLKGYLLQAVVYQLTGEAFCADPNCRLFNAHWQAEMLAAQLGPGPELCPHHVELLRSL